MPTGASPDQDEEDSHDEFDDENGRNETGPGVPAAVLGSD